METADERLAHGKPAEGTVTLETMIAGNRLEIAIADDGAGVDWDRVRDKAVSLGLPCDTKMQLEEALFASGFSTRSAVSEVSGRGVGLDALREACRSLGGDIALSTVRGVGTRIVCSVPLVPRGHQTVPQHMPVTS
ncbi:MAG: ATP-binding protein [Kofleriaceae bacterium]